jgi:hypothetical protein
VPNYEAITLKDIYPGIDLKYSGDGDAQAAYEFIAAPGADIAQIKVEYEGAEETSIDADGRMILQTKWGDMIASLKTPADGAWSGSCAWWTSSSTTSPQDLAHGDVRQAQTSLGTSSVGLVYSTYLGGGGWDMGWDITVDGSGYAYVTGQTESSNFPTLNPYQTDQGGTDVFVTKLSSSGNSLIYSTYLGGSGRESGSAIAVDGSGNSYVTGQTESSNFPTLNPYQATYQGGGTDCEGDVFVTKLSSSGNSLIYSTYLGGGDYDWGSGIAVDGSGNAYVTGFTSSGNFPTQNPFQGTYGGGTCPYSDAFVTKLSSSGNTLIYSTYLGAGGYDGGHGLAVDGSGNAYVTGEAGSGFPTLNPYQTWQGGTDVFVTKLSSAGNSLIYSTYLGGGGQDGGLDITVDGSGNAYVTGYTASSNFPTLNPYQSTYQGGGYDGWDAFVTKLSSTGNSLIYSTYLGGGSGDEGNGIAVDGSGNAYVTGGTGSSDFPTLNPYQTYQGNGDAFVTKLSNSGASLIYSTYLGGSFEENYYLDAGSIAVNGSGNAYVTGHTWSPNFPTLNPYQGTLQGGPDAFVTKLSNEPYFEFVHITDIHVGDSGAAARFEQMVDAINALDPAPAFVVMTGDLVNEGCWEQGHKNFQAFMEIAGGLHMDYYTCPGNHESYFRCLLTPTFDYENELKFPVNWQKSVNGINLISLWSGYDVSLWDCGGIPWLTWNYVDSTGEGSGLTNGQKTQLKDWLVLYPNAPAIMFMHHPVVSYNPRRICADEAEDEGSNGCIRYNRDSVFYLLQDPNNDLDDEDAAKLVLVGHHHENHVYESDNVHRPSEIKGRIETRDYSDDLPLHVMTRDVRDHMTYRMIGVDGDNITVYAPTTLYAATKYCSRTTTSVRKSLSDDSTVYPAARLHAYDSYGNHVGPNGTGGIDLEITGALHHQEAFFDSLSGQIIVVGELISLYTSEDEYRYEFEAEVECTLSVEGELSRQDGTGRKFYYDSIAVVGGSKVTAFVTGDSIDPLLYLDYDGDGTPESQVPPDSVLSYGFVCGDASGDGTVDISDAVYLISYIFSGGPAPVPLLAGDANCDGTVDISDVVYLIVYIFSSGLAPCVGCK